MREGCAALLLSSVLGFSQEVTIRTRVPLVISPTTVIGHSGKFVNELRAEDFVVLDNGKPQKVHMDTSDVALIPISLVIAVQTNTRSTAALAKVRKIGGMVEPLITGERGEVAVLEFNDKIELLQRFTSDAGTISRAFKALLPDGDQAPVVDAVARALELLRERPGNRRKEILLISESRDNGSKVELTDVLKQAQRDDVTVYPLTFSAHLTPWTAKPSDAGPAGYGPDILAALRELARLGKANASEELARFTGGHKLSFLTLKALESDITRLGEEIHGQYLLSFTPDTAADGEFHVLRVSVSGHPDYTLRTRPGYWALPPQ